jgi:hypothetical protein
VTDLIYDDTFSFLLMQDWLRNIIKRRLNVRLLIIDPVRHLIASVYCLLAKCHIVQNLTIFAAHNVKPVMLICAKARWRCQ